MKVLVSKGKLVFVVACCIFVGSTSALLTAFHGGKWLFYDLPSHQRYHGTIASLAKGGSDDNDNFASFEASLEDEEELRGVPTATKTTKRQNQQRRQWQDTLEDLLDPTTPVSKRPTLLTDLWSANQDIRSSVETAIRDRSIDPLLTPRGKRLQEGSKAVARQITSDILPQLMQQPSKGRSSSSPLASPLPLPQIPRPADLKDLQTVGSRFFNVLQNRFQTDFETMQSDFRNDPLRSIPRRISQQSREWLQEALFAEKPARCKEPPYEIVQQSSDYEIRDYRAYTVASTRMVENKQDDDDEDDREQNESNYSSLAPNGVALNTLAAYIFGANKQGLSMEMTTPVTTTSSGEMQLFLDPSFRSDGKIPEPFDDGNDSLGGATMIQIREIPPVRLAVRQFTGFCTRGEIARQKEALLASLAMDNVELDVPHGSTVPHVVFQYNPPYTLPVVRRNEIAVAVLNVGLGDDDWLDSNSVFATPKNGAGSDDVQDTDNWKTSIRDSWEPVE